MTHTHTTILNQLALELFVLYDSFPWLTAAPMGFAFYWQHVTVITVSLVIYSLIQKLRVSNISRQGKTEQVSSQ